MNVFISWSGDKSKAVGNLLDEWLQCVIQAIEPWMSSKDIDRGSLWFSEINDQLKDTAIGIICLTQSNKEKPWILFEAGALAKGLSTNRVCTFLIDLQTSDIENPLAQFNHTIPNKEGMWALVRTLNSYLEDKKLKENILEKAFDIYWPQFEKEFNKINSTISEDVEVKKRSSDDILLEVLSTTRGLERRMRTLETRNNIEEDQNTDMKIINRKNVMSLVIANEIIDQMIQNNIPKQIIIKKLCKLGVPESYVRSSIEERLESNEIITCDEKVRG